MQTEEHPFTEREEQILNLLASYHTREEMCDILGMEYVTLDTHITNIRRKTYRRGIKLVKYAVDRGYGKREVAL